MLSIMRPLVEALFTRTLAHPKWSTFICWAPTEWLISLANPEPLSDTTTSGADGKPDRRVGLEELFQTMLTDGMRDPLVLGIGVESQTVRLETGNQRIRCLLANHVQYVPVIGYVSRTSVTNPENGHHEGMHWTIDREGAESYLHTYVSPDIFLRNTPLVKYNYKLFNV
jgi:hypothetical protein